MSVFGALISYLVRVQYMAALLDSAWQDDWDRSTTAEGSWNDQEHFLLAMDSAGIFHVLLGRLMIVSRIETPSR